MKVKIEEGGVITTARHPLTRKGPTSVEAELVQETKSLGEVSIVLTFLVFGEDANVLEDRRHTVVGLDVAEGGTVVAIMTEDSHRQRWVMVTNNPAPQKV